MQLNVQRGATHTGSQRLFEIHNETRKPGHKELPGDFRIHAVVWA